MGGLRLDLREAVRSWRYQSGLAAVAVLTLAVGLSGAITVFSTFRAAAFDQVPLPDPDRIANVWGTDPAAGLDREMPTLDDFRAWKEQVTGLEEVAAYAPAGATMSGGDEPVRVSGQEVSESYFAALGVGPALGRGFQFGDFTVGLRPVLLSHDLWRRVFGSAPDVLGLSIALDDEVCTVVGVMPEGFFFPARGVDLWVPLRSGDRPAQSDHRPVFVVARLRDGVTPAQAGAELTAIQRRSLPERALTGPGRGVRVVPVSEEALKRAGFAAAGLLGPALVVLLVACGNVANLLLVRASQRRREIAMRAVLGASLVRLVRQLLAESAVLVAPAALLGLLGAWWGTGVLRLAFANVSPFFGERVAFGGPVILFGLIATALTPAVFALAPAVVAARGDVGSGLRDERPHLAIGRGRYGFSDLIVVLELGLTVALLVAASLFARFFIELGRVDFGFDVSHVLFADLPLPQLRDASQEQVDRVCREIIDRVRAVPGVEEAAVADRLPPDPHEQARGGRPVVIEGVDSGSTSGLPRLLAVIASPAYFTAMGMPLRRGRQFTTEDGSGTDKVAVVAESAARRYWPGENPLGKRFRFADAGARTAWISIVGIVGDVMVPGPAMPPPLPLVYLSKGEEPVRKPTLVVRIATDRAIAAAAIKRAVRTIEPQAPLEVVRLDEVLDRRTQGGHLFVRLIGGFALLALFLSAVGVYSVISRSVARRTREIGVRVALGARPLDVLQAVLGRQMALLLAGVALGAFGTMIVTRVVWRELITISGTDPLTWTALTLLLACVGFLASIVPARRATRVDPIIVLRCE